MLLLLVPKNRAAQDLRQESEHFIILTNSDHSTPSEMDQVEAHAELMFINIRDIIGEERMPQKKITIRMEGPFIEQGPYFDPNGIHLFRYSPDENGYLALLTHGIGSCR